MVMKPLATLLIGLVTFTAAAQQYPFPYNPDSNQDGMVSMTDFLEILGVFGQEYPDSFYADSTKAVLDLGRIDATTCLALAAETNNEWRMITTTDVYTSSHLIFAGSAASTEWINNPGHPGTLNYWCWSEDTQTCTYARLKRYDNSNGDYPAPYYHHLESDSTQSYQASLGRSYDDNEIYVQSSSRSCLLITEVKPTIEYIECDSSDCIEDALNNGWQPLCGRGEVLGLWKEAE